MSERKQCESKKCDAIAAWSVFWPGSELVMCDRCKDRAVGLANTMGFNLAVQPKDRAVGGSDHA